MEKVCFVFLPDLHLQFDSDAGAKLVFGFGAESTLDRQESPRTSVEVVLGFLLGSLGGAGELADFVGRL